MKRQKNNMALICGVATIILGVFIFLLTDRKEGEVSRLVIGTYGKHVYTYDFYHVKNEFSFRDKAEAINASYAIALSGENEEKYIFSVSETGEESGVYSFAADEAYLLQTGYLQQTGADPCFVLLFNDGKYLMTADYSGGSISAFPINDSKVGNLCASLKFSGRGPVEGRQESSHIHQLKELPSQSGKWILASDLGADIIRLIKAETSKNGLSLTHIHDIKCPEGSGVRHMELNKDHTTLYCICELSGEVLVYDIRHKDDIPTFTLKQQIQADEVNAGGSADIHIHPSGKWLYTSHRLNNDGISVFSILADGTLEKTGYAHTGRHPRNFMITNDGEYLLVACRDDRTIQVFKIQNDGNLLITDTVLEFEEDRPSSILPY